jgi:hypothetical protein
MTLALKKSEASSVADASAGPLAQPSQTGPRWEYQSMAAKSPDELVAGANQGGAESWELVSTVHVLNTKQYQWVGFFKRLKR